MAGNQAYHPFPCQLKSLFLGIWRTGEKEISFPPTCQYKGKEASASRETTPQAYMQKNSTNSYAQGGDCQERDRDASQKIPVMAQALSHP